MCDCQGPAEEARDDLPLLQCVLLPAADILIGNLDVDWNDTHEVTTTKETSVLFSLFCRGRQNVASFLAKSSNLDWRMGG